MIDLVLNVTVNLEIIAQQAYWWTSPIITESESLSSEAKGVSEISKVIPEY